MSLHQLLLGLVDLSARVAVEELPISVLVARNRTLPRLPGCHRAKEHAVPIQIEETLAIVVPHRRQGAGRAHPLPIANESLNVSEGLCGDWKYLIPVGVAGRDPGLDSGLGRSEERRVGKERRYQSTP